ncbi:MAG: CTP synthase, partial [Longimicrobiales bacterium]|nr:CTP synthase [Longimicrobiales bacterium]
DEIKTAVRRLAPNHDIVITEIGGTVGDMESLPFLEAIRQFRQDVGRQHTLFIHLTLIPYIAAAGELKTKPTQHSARELMEIGIQPDVLICRSDREITDDIKRKIALFTNVDVAGVIEARDVDTIYDVPMMFNRQRLDELAVEKLGLEAEAESPDLSGWQAMVDRIRHPDGGRVKIAMVGKYTSLVDAYKSVNEALIHGGIANDVGVEIDWISSEKFENGESLEWMNEYHGLLIPGGFGERGIEGMLRVIEWARTHDLPFFGICLGLQCAVIEYARNVVGLHDSHSVEFSGEAEDPVICLMDSQRQVTDMGGTMRLGAYPCVIQEGSRAHEAYGALEISERHRHRYEVNNNYRDSLAEAGLRFSGQSPDGNLVEIAELPDHPWFLGCQFHPELKSRPMRPHPLFAAFIKAARTRRDGREPAGEGERPDAGEDVSRQADAEPASVPS